MRAGTGATRSGLTNGRGAVTHGPAASSGSSCSQHPPDSWSGEVDGYAHGTSPMTPSQLPPPVPPRAAWWCCAGVWGGARLFTSNALCGGDHSQPRVQVVTGQARPGASLEVRRLQDTRGQCPLIPVPSSVSWGVIRLPLFIGVKFTQQKINHVTVNDPVTFSAFTT